MVFSFLLSSLSLSLSSLFPFFPLASCIHTPNLETHFGFASIPSDESRLDQRLDAVVNRHVEVEDGGCKEKEKEEGNGLRGGGRRPTIRGKRLFDVASWTLAFGARSVPNFILFPAQPFVKHRRAAGKEFSPLGSSFVVQRTRRGDTPDGSIARMDFCEGKTLFSILLLYLLPVSIFFFFPSHRFPCSPEESGNENVSILREGKDLRVNPLTRETAFHSELFPMEILSPLSAFVQSWIGTFLYCSQISKEINFYPPFID